MKIGIIGAGALGCYYGAKLARCGAAVHFIARGATLQALRSKGVTVHRDDGSFSVSDFHATDRADNVGPVELLIVATKSYAFEAIAPALRALKGPDTIVLPLQNGVDSAERLGVLADPEHILGGLTYLPVSAIAPGVVRQSGVEKPILLGPLNEADEAAARTTLSVLQKADIAAERPADIRVALWMKYMLAICTMGVQSVTGCPIGPTREDPDTRALYLACLREVDTVARAGGVNLPDGAQENAMRAIDSYPAAVKASMLQDLECGKPLELEAMHGTLVRLGKTYGVETPVNQFIYAALKLRAGGSVGSAAGD
ncbi:ketopantoate reductase family protein [Pontiella agarivorans]|uniref:2-dehydropantoate 2-reductase n=1 Tax=Pontiella agarivorans TaxID=3038953 RepID=A0ABU5MZ54_9BACT|nr:2-dehydropantoate 2-reductase [Pontiella agarivorans]MDZ8119483.1 2-dehydropantoate 2-reductase [Pontiella agarivorans]